MRSVWSRIDRQLLRDVAAAAGAVAAVGASFGAIAVASGMSVWLVTAMSVLVFAGGAQFMAVGVVAGGGNPLAAVLAALLLNVRHLPFGLAVADVLGRRWATRLVGSHLMVDESVAFTMARLDPFQRRAAYWTCGVSVFVAWNAGSLAGALLGTAVADPAALGLDAAFPAGMLALLLPAMRAGGGRLVALVAAGVALLATPFLPAGAPVLLAMVAVLVAVRGGPVPTGERAQ